MVRRQCLPLFNSASDAFSILYLLSSNAVMPSDVVTPQRPSPLNNEIDITGVKKHRHTHIFEYKMTRRFVYQSRCGGSSTSVRQYMSILSIANPRPRHLATLLSKSGWRLNGTNFENGVSTNSTARTGSRIARTWASFSCQQRREWQQEAWAVAEERFWGTRHPPLPFSTHCLPDSSSSHLSASPTLAHHHH